MVLKKTYSKQVSDEIKEMLKICCHCQLPEGLKPRRLTSAKTSIEWLFGVASNAAWTNPVKYPDICPHTFPSGKLTAKTTIADFYRPLTVMI